MAVISTLFLFFYLAPGDSALGASTTRYIRSNGGDCASIGSWDQATKTCTLASDLVFDGANGIVVDADGVTLDGAGHAITGSGGFTSGVSALVKSNITIRNLTVRQFRYGINLLSTGNVTIQGNTLTGNTYGAYLQNATGTRIYNNNFDVNANQAQVAGGSGNVFSVPAPDGGNWWSGYDSPLEGCNDYNTDYMCDAPLAVGGGHDELPWNTRDAWAVPPAPDTEPPAITSVEPAGVIGTGTMTITVAYTDRSNIEMATAAVTLDGTAVSGCAVTETGITCPAVSGYSLGSHSIGGTVSDILGNTAVISGTFSYEDDQPPVITGLAPVGFVTGSPVISADYTDAGTGVDPVSVAVTVDGAQLSGCVVAEGNVSCPTSGLADGPHSAIVSVSDLAGNTASASTSFTVDTGAPLVSGVSPAGTIGTGSATVRADYSDTGSGIDPSSVTVSLDGSALAGCSTSQARVSCAVKDLAQGAHTISGSVSDRAGNTSSISGTFIFSDTAPPVMTDIKPPIIVNKPDVIVGAALNDVGTGVDAASAAIYLDGTALTDCTMTAANASCWAYGLGLGSHSYSITVSDKAGNTAVAGGTFTYDPAAPTVSKTLYLSTSSTGGDCSKVGFWFPSTKTCVLKEDLMFIGTNGIVVNSDGINIDGGGHFIVGTGSYTTGVTAFLKRDISLRNLTIKQFRYGALLVSSSNSVLENNSLQGNYYGLYLSSSTSNTIFNNNFVDNTYPAFVNGGSGNLFSLPAPEGGNYWSGFDTAEEGCTDGSGDGFCDAAYAVYGAADDLPWTAPSAWPAPPGYDGLAPQITDIMPSGILSAGSATISAYYSDSGTGVDAASVAVYLDGSTLSGCSITASSASCQVYGLADGSHTIMVSAADNMGNTGSATGTFKVDTTPPNILNIVPSGYITSSSASAGAYVYDAVSGVDSASVSVYVEGATVSGCAFESGNATCDVYGLAEGSHLITVGAADLAGNSASASGYLSVDTSMPQITNLKPTGTVSKSSATISAYLSDTGSGIDTAGLMVYLDGSELSGCGITASSASCNVYGLAEGAHSYTVQAADIAGNTTSADGIFTVDTRVTTKYLRATSTGGDCTALGVWDNATKTCTLTSDFTFASTNGIVIEADGITLDGGGHTITGAGGFTSGVSAAIRANVTIRNLTVRQFNYGINLLSSSNTTVTGNTLTANNYGVFLQNCSGARIYLNSFDANTAQAQVSGGSGNVFNLTAPEGGNWWSNFDTPGEGCEDAGGDGFCDSPYIFTGGRDDLPRVAPG